MGARGGRDEVAVEWGAIEGDGLDALLFAVRVEDVDGVVGTTELAGDGVLTGG